MPCTAGLRSLIPSLKAAKPTKPIVATITSSAIVRIGPLRSVRHMMSGLIMGWCSHLAMAALFSLIHLRHSVRISGLPSVRRVHMLLMTCSGPIASDHLLAVATTSARIKAALSPRKASRGKKHFLLYFKMGGPVASAIEPISRMTCFRTALFDAFWFTLSCSMRSPMPSGWIRICASRRMACTASQPFTLSFQSASVNCLISLAFSCLLISARGIAFSSSARASGSSAAPPPPPPPPGAAAASPLTRRGAVYSPFA